jgi:hypothetical protein
MRSTTVRELATGSHAASAITGVTAAATGEVYVCGRDSGMPMSYNDRSRFGATSRGYLDIFVMKFTDPAFEAVAPSGMLSGLACAAGAASLEECAAPGGWAGCSSGAAYAVCMPGSPDISEPAQCTIAASAPVPRAAARPLAAAAAARRSAPLPASRSPPTACRARPHAHPSFHSPCPHPRHLLPSLPPTAHARALQPSCPSRRRAPSRVT